MAPTQNKVIIWEELYNSSGNTTSCDHNRCFAAAENDRAKWKKKQKTPPKTSSLNQVSLFLFSSRAVRRECCRHWFISSSSQKSQHQFVTFSCQPHLFLPDIKPQLLQHHNRPLWWVLPSSSFLPLFGPLPLLFTMIHISHSFPVPSHYPPRCFIYPPPYRSLQFWSLSSLRLSLSLHSWWAWACQRRVEAVRPQQGRPLSDEGLSLYHESWDLLALNQHELNSSQILISQTPLYLNVRRNLEAFLLYSYFFFISLWLLKKETKKLSVNF